MPSPLGAEEVRELREIGDNTGSMTLKGASPEYSGAPVADRWELDDELSQVAARWEIEPGRDLRKVQRTTVNR